MASIRSADAGRDRDDSAYRAVGSGLALTQPWDTVWIIGGGPSVNDFDLTLLAGECVLAVNDAIHLYPDATAVFSLDGNWVRRNKQFLAGFRGEKYVALPLETFPACAGIPGVQYFEWGHGDGLSEDPGVINTGCNSGYGAIGIAFLKGASSIHLIGYDMDPKDNNDYQFWAPLFRGMLPQLAERGVTVLNHNPRSFIDAFEKVKR